MKRKIALFLTVIMVFIAMIPVQVFAEKDKGLEKAITIAKEKFNIPKDFVFNPESYTDNGKKVWNLNWSSKDGNDGNIYIRIDDKGTILSYDRYRPGDYSGKKLPKVSKQEAQKKAEAFLKKVNPGVLPKIKPVDNNANSLMDYAYYFNYIRVVNGISFYDNSVNINVNKETGEIQSYYYNWNDEYVFPDASKAINSDAAKQAYIKNLGIKLIYKYSYEDDKIGIYGVYTPKYGDTYVIDAFTGEKLRLNDIFYGGQGGNGGRELAMDSKVKNDAAVVLTPEEKKAIEDMSKLISEEEAEKIARDFKPLKLTSEYKISYGPSLSRNWPVKDDYVWNLNFTKEAAEGKDYAYANITINAETGEIIRFYRSINYNENEKPKFDEAKAKQAVEDFMKSFKSDKFKEFVYDDSEREVYPLYKTESEAPREFYFNYSRSIKGVLFPQNGISVGFDAVNGEVYNFNMDYFNVDFPALDKALPAEKVYEKLFSDIGLELQYKVKYSQENAKIMPVPNGKAEIKLVYGLKPGKPQFFDANTGKILDYSGKPYKENKPAVYTDIKGHAAEKQITVLSEYGVSLEGTEFKPDTGISQLDFLTLLSKTLNYYYGPYVTKESSSKDIDNLYKILYREGIIKESEKAPNAAVTKQEAVKYLIRAMKYDKVADIRGIYNVNFKDKAKINPDLIGYVAIAQGLKIVSGSNGYFNPESKLTRAQTAVMIYNYLQV